MGLGKTLQLLTLVAWAFERDPSLPPALVVAPVSLLENWEQEAKKFLVDGTLNILIAYGDALAALKVPRENVDEQLRKEGLVKFLRPDWRGSANVVLTTYETLRDLEFSFAAVKWSAMVCDEAQRIKNPNAMTTRAAKKMNVTFRIACTGTPVENTLTDLWCLFDYVRLDRQRKNRPPYSNWRATPRIRLLDCNGCCSLYVLMQVESLGEAQTAGCAFARDALEASSITRAQEPTATIRPNLALRRLFGREAAACRSPASAIE
jgi:SNF2 family DNA or RNA helicase